MFILNDTIKKADTTLKLMKIDTNDVNLHKSCNLIQIGTAAKLHIYKKSRNFKESTLRRFYKEVCMLFASLTSHFMEKSPLKYFIVCCSSYFNPIVLNQRRQTKLRAVMKKCWRNQFQNTEKSLLILIYLLTDLMTLLYHFCPQRSQIFFPKFIY